MPAEATPTESCATATRPLADVKERFGERTGNTADLLHLLCGGSRRAGNVQSCVAHPVRAHHDPSAWPGTCTCWAAPSRSRSTRAPRRRGPSSTSPSGTSTTRAPPDRPDPARAVRAGKVTCRTSRGCATGCPPSRASPTATWCGARARPTRCASGCCRSPAPTARGDRPPLVRWAARGRLGSMVGLCHRPGRPPARASMTATNQPGSPQERPTHTVVVPNSIDMVSVLVPETSTSG